MNYENYENKDEPGNWNLESGYQNCLEDKRQSLKDTAAVGSTIKQ